ncbi:unnamed protein product, partial [Mycena citricolor]
SVRTWVESCFARPTNSVPVTLLISLSYVLLALYNVSKHLIRCTISSLFHSQCLVGTLQSNLVHLLPTLLRHAVAPPVDVTRSPSPFLFLKLSSWQGARCSAATASGTAHAPIGSTLEGGGPGTPHTLSNRRLIVRGTPDNADTHGHWLEPSRWSHGQHRKQAYDRAGRFVARYVRAARRRRSGWEAIAEGKARSIQAGRKLGEVSEMGSFGA